MEQQQQPISSRAQRQRELGTSLVQPKSTTKRTPLECQQMLQQLTHLDAKVFSGHLIDAIKDEVSLEGLDGITIQALKIRLEERPNFNIEGFEDIASAIWNQMKYCKCFAFYALHTPRPDFVPYCWDDYRDDRGNAYEPLHSPEEIYLYNPIDDKKRGVRGSCMHYDIRKDVTHIIKRISYIEAIQLFGNRLVIVAAQYLREKALLGLNYKKHSKLTIVQYCIMERVGRSRYYGEITRGKISSSCMKIQPKTLFYMRKHLITSKLILRQSVSIKFPNCRCPAGVTVFHLPRFYKRIESMPSLNTRIIFSWLNSSETKGIPVEMVVSKYGKHTMRSLTSQFPTLLETAWEHVAPEDTGGEPKKKPKARAVRVLRLKHSDVKIQNQLIAKVLDGHAVEDDSTETPDTQEESNEEMINIESASSYSDVLVLRPAHQYVTSTDNHRLFYALMRSGICGLTLIDISTLMSLTPLESRSAGRFLTRHNACKEGVIKMVKQRAFTYIITNFSTEDLEIHMNIQDKFMFAMLDLQKIRDFIEENESKLLVQKAIKHNKSPEKIETGCHGSQYNPLPAIEAAPEKQIEKEKGSLKAKRGSKKKSKKSKTIPNSPQFTYEDLILTPVPMDQPPATTHGLNMTPKESSIPGLRINETSAKDHDCSDVVGSSAQLVAVIPIRVLLDTNTGDESVLEESKDEDGNNKEIRYEPDTDDTCSIISNSDADEVLSQASTESDEDEDDEVNEVLNPTRKPRRGDDVDELIRGRMSRQRVDWKDAEDRLITLAFIGGSMFISKYNYAKVFIFNASQIRDLMLKKTEGKSNKTSAAIRRRIHFLINQKSRFEEYVGLVRAALRDDFLYENFVREHMRPPQQKIYFNPPINALEAVLDYLDDKLTGERYASSDTPGSLSAIETLQFFRQLKRAEFYWKSTMFAIFCPMGDTSQSRGAFYRQWRSTLHVKNEKGPDSEHTNNNENENSNDDVIEKMPSTLYDSLSDNDDDIEQVPPILYAAPSDNDDDIEQVRQIGEDELVGQIEKLEEIKTPQDLYLDFCWKFLKFTTKQCITMFKNMLIFGSMNKNGFQIMSFSMLSTLPNVCSSLRECTSVSEVRLWTARSLVLDLIFSGDSSKLLDRSAVDKCKFPLERAARSLTRARVLVYSKRTGLLAVSRVNLKKIIGGLPSYSYDEMLEFLQYIDETHKVDSLACISVGILYGIVELTDHFKSSITVVESVFTLNEDLAMLYEGMSPEDDDSSKKEKKTRPKRRKKGVASSRTVKKRRVTVEEERVDVDGLDGYDELTKEIHVSVAENDNVGLEEGESYTSSSANTLRLLRVRLNQAGLNSNNFTGFVEKDFFTLNLPNLEFVFPRKGSLNHKLAGTSHPFSDDVLKELRRALVELVYHRISDTPGSTKIIPNLENHLKKYAILFNVINTAGVVGVSGLFLETLFERKSLVKGLRYLLEAKLIFSVGVARRKFVTYNNLKDWVIPIRPQVTNSSVGHVITRPWITSIGGLCWITISRLFISLLGQMQRPSIPFDELCRVFLPTLSPVESTVLIEALAMLKYITIYRLQTYVPTLFSKSPSCSASDIEYNADTLIDTNDVYVAVSPYITFLHSQLNHAIQRAAKKQFMS